jgi:hypothetical protein
MKFLNPHAINALLLGLVIGAVIGTILWFVTERLIFAIVAGIVPIILLLCFVRSVFIAGPKN